MATVSEWLRVGPADSGRALTLEEYHESVERPFVDRRRAEDISRAEFVVPVAELWPSPEDREGPETME